MLVLCLYYKGVLHILSRIEHRLYNSSFKSIIVSGYEIWQLNFHLQCGLNGFQKQTAELSGTDKISSEIANIEMKLPIVYKTIPRKDFTSSYKSIVYLYLCSMLYLPTTIIFWEQTIELTYVDDRILLWNLLFYRQTFKSILVSVEDIYQWNRKIRVYK